LDTQQPNIRADFLGGHIHGPSKKIVGVELKCRRLQSFNLLESVRFIFAKSSLALLRDTLFCGLTGTVRALNTELAGMELSSLLVRMSPGLKHRATFAFYTTESHK